MVIVVFLVGVLALVQIFPPGLSALRTSSASLLATSLAEAEVERLAGSSGQLPDYIGTVRFRMTPGGLEAVLDGTVATRNLMPPKDPDPAPGRLNQAGQIVLAGGPLGDWQLVGASNRINRVIGESHKVPAPRAVGAQFGCLVNLNFGPIYYYLQPAGVGAGFLQVYGNEMARRAGDRLSSSPVPATFGVPREWEFYFVDRDLTGASGPTQPFPGQDQVWVGPSNAKELRVAMTFAYASPGGTQQFEMVLSVQLNPAAPPTYAAIVDNYWVISLPELAGQPDIHGRTLYNPANVLGVYRDSVRVQRLYQEVPITAAFNPLNPFQYKAINGSFGTILVNPAAFDFEVRTGRGQRVPLLATADYTVLDWRILRDEMRLPSAPGDLKLVMGGIKALGVTGPDGRDTTGIGVVGPALGGAGALEVRVDDFVLMDVKTGAIILGNMADATHAQNGYSVNKRTGYLQLRDIDPGTPGVQVGVAYATGDPLAPWTAVVEDVAGHAVRALYMAVGEWSVQVYKAASRYRVTDVVAANGLQVAECYVGGSRLGGAGPVGAATRLYFPMSDLGQRVVVGEIWYRDAGGALKLVRDQDLLLGGVENLLGVDHSFAELAPYTLGEPFDFSMGYAVRRVRGASMTVRVLNNPSYFFLGADEVDNFRKLELWAQRWRRHETESFVAGGEN